MAKTLQQIAAELDGTAQTYRKELLLIALLGMEKVLPHFTLRTGVRYKDTVGTMDGPVELQDYTGENDASSDFEITARTIETHLGSCVKLFDPNELVKTLYGSAITSGKAIEASAINKQICAIMMNKISNGLAKSIFGAVRKTGGKKTNELFDGIDTITATEITAGKISVDLGNLYELATVIDKTNAVDVLKAIYQRASDELQDKEVKMYLSKDIYNCYTEDYKATTGAIPYNTQYKQTFLEGSDNNCMLTPLVCKKSSPFIHLSTKQNMLLGCNQVGDYEKIEVRRGDNAFKLQFICTMFFGTQMESLDKTNLLVAKLAQQPAN